ncbi:ribosome biogenesis protein (nucleomorph) [Chroomonas mesostigmatica CCMP1168]|uniref:60S ribosome subunit biogenesis protein NIP7 homolog n=1 Tax=Chroomonas mesostigmatica CCMP1168 TaxID=1195612 RepID=J7GAD6_9CRYP|nr:ribosome biogenesis protein [Chroomonas mesostigmatica CCMP1168]|mmetsp:Transcript_66762/g.164528  ORF Transcript_66762/g.164528 Transcript_66762/m.164528 type:complete len:179 (-) Transcript_66762:7727-8263(-)
MRELKIEEARLLLSKFVKFQGDSIRVFIKNFFFDSSVFRLQKNRIFFCSFILAVRALNFFKKKIGSIGTCIGRFTHSKKFQFLVPSLSLVIKNEKYLFAVTNSNGEKNFINGKHLKKDDVLRISKNLFRYDGIVVIGKNKFPIGFGEILKSTKIISTTKKKHLIITNHADIGKYTRLV